MPQTLHALPASPLALTDQTAPADDAARFWLDLAQALGIAVLLVTALFLIMGFLIMPGLPGA
ncbi:MAG: hypothetical protein EKK45_00435 [Curvibacter sp.]|nr:MAG: hypothetical protein EKK45_00435 [Curvibacter sp.]